MAEIIGINKSNLYTQVPTGATTTMEVNGVGVLLVQIASHSTVYYIVNLGEDSAQIVSSSSSLSTTNESGKMNIKRSGSTVTFTNNASSALVTRAYYYRIS